MTPNPPDPPDAIKTGQTTRPDEAMALHQVYLVRAVTDLTAEVRRAGDRFAALTTWLLVLVALLGLLLLVVAWLAYDVAFGGGAPAPADTVLALARQAQRR